jgi:hypothetical protein
MSRHKLISVFGVLLFGLSVTATSQEVVLEDLRKNISIFSGVLENALDLQQSNNIFSTSSGNIAATYLHNQGVILEIRSPLANRRNQLSLGSFRESLLRLQSNRNPFVTVNRPTMSQSREAMALNLRQDQLGEYYREMMQKISEVDYSAVVNSAIQQASEAASSLRSLGDIDEDRYNAMRDEIAELKESLSHQMDKLGDIEAGVRNQTGAAGADIDNSGFDAMMLELTTKAEELRDQAVTKANGLKQRNELAKQQYAERWQLEVEQFETNLYVAMCDYGATLRELPEKENVSVVLEGLGPETDSNRRTDRIHVFSMSDLMQCQASQIDVATLRGRATQYNY